MDQKLDGHVLIFVYRCDDLVYGSSKDFVICCSPALRGRDHLSELGHTFMLIPLLSVMAWCLVVTSVCRRKECQEQSVNSEPN